MPLFRNKKVTVSSTRIYSHERCHAKRSFMEHHKSTLVCLFQLCLLNHRSLSPRLVPGSYGSICHFKMAAKDFYSDIKGVFKGQTSSTCGLMRPPSLGTKPYQAHYLSVCCVFRAHVQFCWFNKTDATADVQ